MRFLMLLTVGFISLASAEAPGFGMLVNGDGSFGATFRLDEPVKEWYFGPDSINSRNFGFS